MNHIYYCTKRVAITMRNQGYKFWPVLKNMNRTKEYRKLDYEPEITLEDRKLKITITI